MKVEKIQNETGRSMVEMLGVLAIVGVISIGGIAGYSYGMNRHRMNEVLDGANKRAYTVATQISLGITPNLSEYSIYDAVSGGEFQQEVQNWGGEFGIQVNKVKQPVCENLIQMVGSNTAIRAITKVEDKAVDLKAGDCIEGDNNLYLIYNLDMMAAVSGTSTRKDSPSTLTNCWKEGNCQPSDLVENGLECIYGGTLHASMYCECVQMFENESHGLSPTAAQLEQCAQEDDNSPYVQCRKKGHSAIYCAGSDQYGYCDANPPTASKAECDCYDAGGTADCCNCKANFDLSDCVDLGVCSAGG